MELRRRQTRHHMIFGDRHVAGIQLARKLKRYRNARPLVLAIPRGGVPIAAVIAERLAGELDTLFVGKLGSPYNEEFAIGSVDEAGNANLFGNPPLVGPIADYIDREKARQMQIMRGRRAVYTPNRQAADPRGRVTILVDDGLATGATLLAALQSVRRKGPARLIVAVPVASVEGLAKLSKQADEMAYLAAPEHFLAVSQFYRHFPELSDEDVIAALRAINDRRSHLH